MILGVVVIIFMYFLREKNNSKIFKNPDTLLRVKKYKNASSC